MIKVMIADDQELIRKSLHMLIGSNPDMEITGMAANGQEIQNIVAKNQPDVIIMDIRMPIIDGVQCTKHILEKYPKIKILVLTTFDDDEYISDAIKYGASGYLLKGEPVENIVSAIRKVYFGDVVLSQQAMKLLVKMVAKNEIPAINQKESKLRYSSLTRSEAEIVDQVIEGYSNKEIANILHLSEGTVRNYLSNILGKLELRDRTQLAIWAMKQKK